MVIYMYTLRLVVMQPYIRYRIIVPVITNVRNIWPKFQGFLVES